ncbi:MAG: sulfurtransferase [Schleiferiaceae bacterium]|jgi:thiosulfate/3-mercaptopyruvate sulfurtransferase|nr:sulfurtransferase [Schleiferiaceae bacterium]
MAHSDFLVTAKQLQQKLNDSNIVIIDCHWDENAYIRAHIPGALKRPGHPYIKSQEDGIPNKFLPKPDEFLDLLNSMGITNETEVICYDEWHNHFATRMWWVMHYYGHKNVKLLDGGWQAWVAEGLPISFQSENPQVTEEKFRINENQSFNAQLKEILANYKSEDWQILDVRSDAEFKGEVLSGNKRGGHIPNAIHLEWKRLLSPSTKYEGVSYFKSEVEMKALFDEAGIKKDKTIAVHCQAGVRASFSAFCLEMLGYPNVKLYDGSMGEWANEKDTPLEK